MDVKEPVNQDGWIDCEPGTMMPAPAEILTPWHPRASSLAGACEMVEVQKAGASPREEPSELRLPDGRAGGQDAR
jgi:hypothetical protein